MIHPCEQTNVSWLDERIREAEARIASNKKQLDRLDAQGLTSGRACRELAVNAKHLHILKMRREVLRKTGSPGK